MKQFVIPNPNVGATFTVALNSNMNKHGANTHAQGANTTAHGANTHAQGANTATTNANITAQGDREGRPYATPPTVTKPTILATVFVFMHMNIVETDNYPSLRNNTSTTGGSL
jgi:hypothetical protein